MKNSKREVFGIIFFLVIICLEVTLFWGKRIITMIAPKSYFTVDNIVEDIEREVSEDCDPFILNEKAGYLGEEDVGEVDLIDVIMKDDECKVKVCIEWYGSKPIAVEYNYDIVYRKKKGIWKISSIHAEPYARPDGLLGTWKGNVSSDGDFFSSAYNYDVEYKFDGIDGDTVTGTVTTYDRLGTEGEDTVTLVGIWNERTATLALTFERAVSSQEFGAGDLYFDPADGLLKSGLEYRKVD